uniref:Uncharacterized protein n=1 Tax=Crocodylus porosus TaxID=8502 RepID=A0A7M4FPG1_CROPO
MAPERLSVWSKNGLCVGGRPSWRRVGMDILPEDLKEMELETQRMSTCLPYPLDQLSLYFTNLEITKGWLDILRFSVKVVLSLLCSLSVHYLWIKWKLHQRKLCGQHTSNVDKMPSRLVANTSRMLKYLKHNCHHERKEVPPWQLNKRRKVEETEDDEDIFPACPYNHCSSVDTVMQEV